MTGVLWIQTIRSRCHCSLFKSNEFDLRNGCALFWSRSWQRNSSFSTLPFQVFGKYKWCIATSLMVPLYIHTWRNKLRPLTEIWCAFQIKLFAIWWPATSKCDRRLTLFWHRRSPCSSRPAQIWFWFPWVSNFHVPILPYWLYSVTIGHHCSLPTIYWCSSGICPCILTLYHICITYCCYRVGSPRLSQAVCWWRSSFCFKRTVQTSCVISSYVWIIYTPGAGYNSLAQFWEKTELILFGTRNVILSRLTVIQIVASVTAAQIARCASAILVTLHRTVSFISPHSKTFCPLAVYDLRSTKF